MNERSASNRFRETVTSGTGHFKAVCHKCQYVGFEPNHIRCAHCGFPIILEPYESARVALREIFDRSSVELGVNVKAPPLPGVDPRKRKAQLLAEARRRLRTESQLRAATAEPAARTDVDALADVDAPADVAAPAEPRTAYPAAAYQAEPRTAYPAAAYQVEPARAPTHEPAPARAYTFERPESRAHTYEPAFSAAGARLGTYQAMSPRRARLGMALAFISAIIAGVALAAANSGL